MSSLIIAKKELEKSGRKLMKEFYETIHDDYMLETFDEFKLQRKFYDENLTKEFLSFYENKYEDLVKMNTKDLLKLIENKIKDKSLDFKFIYHFLEKMDRELKIDDSIEFEIYEDLYCLKKTFMKAYELFYYDYYNIED